MKKIFLIMCLLSSFIFCDAKQLKNCSTNERTNDAQVEIVNEKTVIFKDVIKIEIVTNDENQITYIYDLNKSKLVAVEKGSFKVNTSKGNYLVQSTKKITKTKYNIIEQKTIL